MNELLQFSERIDVLPVIHGSGDFSGVVRQRFFEREYSCIALPLPGSWQDAVVDAVDSLPSISSVVQRESAELASYVPVDPCQPAIAAIRLARQERRAIEFVDLETRVYEGAPSAGLPDAYALKGLSVEKFSAAVLPAIPRPKPDSIWDQRCRRMAFDLHRLELEYDRILFVCGMFDWPWIREAFVERRPYPEHERFFEPISTFAVHRKSLAFFLGELPFVTSLYEKARSTLDSDEHLSVEGVKELLLESRKRWRAKNRRTHSWLTPKTLRLFLQYVRNLTIMNRRLTPDLYTLVAAAKQIAGDGFARALLETACEYSVGDDSSDLLTMKMSVDRADLPGEGLYQMKSRLPGPKVTWRALELKPEPPPKKIEKWKTMWNPYQQCSYPPEDQKIESFQTHVREQAKAMIGADLVRSEKFTSSVKDGLDIRETLRNWHTGDLYVKEIPPSRGEIEIVVFLFEVPADPSVYNWRTTWHAEHNEESTIGLYATDFRQDIIGPGIGRSTYGGVFFLRPPRYIQDIWDDPRLPELKTLEERLLAAACLHSSMKHIAVVSPCPLRSSWRRIAKAFGKRFVHLPLSRFSGLTIQKLRTVHVLNGREIRSFAAKFIREGD